jgi:hypothetical protein
MSQPDADTLARIAPLRRQLRDIKGISESRAGVFACAGKPLIELVMRDTKLLAELRGAGAGQTVLRFEVDEPLQARKLVEEARRRVARMDDD